MIRKARWVFVNAIALFLLSSIPCWAVVSQVKCATGDWSSGNTLTATITSTAAGDLLALFYGQIAGDMVMNLSTIADGHNTYTAIDSLEMAESGSNYALKTYYAKNIVGGNETITVTLNETPPGGSNARIVVCEVSGASTTSPLDQHSGVNRQVNPTTGGDDVTSGAVVTTANGEYIFGTTLASLSTTITTGTGFTLSSTDTARFVAEFQIQSSAGSIASTFGSMFANLRTWYTAEATFKADVAASAGHPLSLIRVGH